MNCVNCNYVFLSFESLFTDKLLTIIAYIESITVIFGIFSKSLQKNRLLIKHDLTENAGNKEFRMVGKNNFLLDASFM